jgi:transposase
MGMRPHGSKQDLAIRRRAAVALRKQGFTIRQVANVIGCVPSSVVRWEQLFDDDGAAGLNPKPQKSGAKPRLSDGQRERLRDALLEGARAHGWSNELWTLSRVAKLIEREFGVGYHISHVHRMLGRMGFSAQKPARRAREQSLEAVEAFRKRRWRAIKKKRVGRAAASS